MKRIPWLRIVCAILLVLNLLFIWGNSRLSATESAALSVQVKLFLSRWWPELLIHPQGGVLIRKSAHFCEFCTLGMLLIGIHGPRAKKWFRIVICSLICAMAIAGLDELIQFTSPGRTPSILDVALDSAGAAIGIGILCLGFYIYKKIKNNIISGGKQK